MVAQSESAFGKKLEMAQPRFPRIFRRCEQGNLFRAPYCINENIDFWSQISIIVRVGYRNPVPIWHRYLCNRYVLEPNQNADFGASFRCHA